MDKGIDYTKHPESDVIVDYIMNRYKKGFYTMVLVIGLPGTGKSSVCFRLAEKIQEAFGREEKFKIDNVVDSQLGLINAIRKSTPGEVIIIEELSVLFPSRRAMATENVDVGRILDTCRKKQVILLTNAPILKSIDSHVRAMAHLSLETLRIVRSQGIVVSKPLRLQTNPSSGKTYMHRLLRDGKDVHRTYTFKPQSDIWEQYENKKDKFMDDLYEKLKHKALKKEEKLLKDMGKKNDIPIVRLLTAKELKVHQMFSIKNMKVPEIATAMDVSTRRIYAILKNIDKKSQITKGNEQKNIQKQSSEPIT